MAILNTKYFKNNNGMEVKNMSTLNINFPGSKITPDTLKLVHEAFFKGKAHKKLFNPLKVVHYGVNSATYTSAEDIRNLVNNNQIKLEAIGENGVHYFRCYQDGVDQNRALLIDHEGYGKFIPPEVIPDLAKENVRFYGKNFKVGSHNIENLIMFKMGLIKFEQFEKFQIHHVILRAVAELEFLMPLTKDDHKALHKEVVGGFSRNQIIHLTPKNFEKLMSILNELRESLKNL